MDDFEKELIQAMERRPAPPSLKGKVMQRRGLLTVERRRHNVWLAWQWMAAGLLVAAMLGGAVEWRMRKVEEQRQGEEARRQVMIALRITGRALNEVNAQLTAHSRGDE
jgi:hypothetical protein